MDTSEQPVSGEWLAVSGPKQCLTTPRSVANDSRLIYSPRTLRVRVDGKFFARGEERLRVQGVTYGPFTPAGKGGPFPLPKIVEDDFRRMKAAAINSLRTYHLPPEWFLDKADEQGLAVFVDVPWAKHLCFLESHRARPPPESRSVKPPSAAEITLLFWP